MENHRSLRAMRAGLVLVAALMLVLSGHARAQEAGHGAMIRGTGTNEVDSCEPPRGISEAEAENRAADHYDRGLNLYEQGDYEAAIEEFMAAYCHKPYYLVLKDIAQSFERMVDYEKAVAYLERYVRETPADRAEERQVQSARVQVLRNLPARVRIATVPPGAIVTLSNASGVRARGISNDEEPLLIRTGTYTLTIALDGYEAVSESIDVKIGQPYSYYYRLEPRTGTLRVAAVPPNARIFVDKRAVGLGSHVEELPIGRYVIEVEADGYLPARRELTISENNQTRTTIALERVPRSGRTELLIAASVGGAAWGGSAFTAIFGENELGTLGTALGLGIGLGGAYLGIPRDISVGSSSFIVGSTLVGVVEGLLVSSLFSCETVQQMDTGLYRPDTCDGEVIAGVGLMSGVGGAVFGALAGPRFALDAGDAAIINSGALWGVIAGGLFYSVFDQDARVDEALVLSGLNLGVLTGALVAQRSQVSRGHVALIDLSGLAGIIVGTAMASVIPDEGEQVPHLALAGMTIGLITGAYLTRHMDEPPRLPSLSPSVGAARDLGGAGAMTLGISGTF